MSQNSRNWVLMICTSLPAEHVPPHQVYHAAAIFAAHDISLGTRRQLDRIAVGPDQIIRQAGAEPLKQRLRLGGKAGAVAHAASLAGVDRYREQRFDESEPLRRVPFLFYLSGQEIRMTASPSLIAAAIADAPAWALIGLTMPDEQMRERGVEELARWIAERLDPRPPVDRRQLGLPL